LRGDKEAAEWLPEDVHPIFVHDRGGDVFSLYEELSKESATAGFVVRANQNRRILTENGEAGKLFDWSSDLAERGRHSIEIQQGVDEKPEQPKSQITAGSCELCAREIIRINKDPSK